MTQHRKHTVQRTFILGDSWLYFKLYTGHKTADYVIANSLFPLTENLLKQGLIEKWFFIRYHDETGPHLRFRMEMTEPQRQLGKVLLASNNAFKPMIEANWIWKIQTDTYQRELERYGTLTMLPAESLFFQNSHMMARLIGSFQDDMDEVARWLFALPAIDQLLDAFGTSLEYRHHLMDIVRNNFAQEFGMDVRLRDQLEDKFKKEQDKVFAALSGEGLESPVLQRLAPMLALLKQYDKGMKETASEILELRKRAPQQESLNNLLASYIHMLMNRLFKSKQRVHEMVIYDFITRYYKSLLEAEKRKNTMVEAEAEKLLTE
ncbi:MAG: thiopeptide-type bacteriocin biosynthesis protein [Bacteroidia bacterium]